MTTRRRHLPALIFLFIAACSPIPPGQQDPENRLPQATLAITNVQIIPVSQPGLLQDQTLLINGRHIVKIAPASEVTLPAGIRTLDGRGRYLIPGLVDMHEHLPRGDAAGEYPLDRYFDLQLAAGVTTIRTMRGQKGDPELRDAIASGEIEGPRLIVGSPGFNDELAPDPRSARALVHQYEREGFDFIKILDPLGQSTFSEIIATAKELDMPIAGHLPDSISPDQALAAYWTLEHLHGHGSARLAGQQAFVPVALATAESGVWICPTLGFQVSWYGQASIEEMSRWPGMAYAAPGSLAYWTERVNRQITESELSPSENRARMQARYAAVLELANAGVGILVSASGGWFLVPGFSIFVEFRCLDRAGLSPGQILQAATYDAARALGKEESWGSIQEGMLADLVLLDADPLQDIRNAEAVRAVIREGVLYERDELDRRLAKVR